MADVDLTCPDCAKVVTVSEFVDPDSIVCSGCGTKLHKPGQVSTKAKPSVLKLKKNESAYLGKDRSDSTSEPQEYQAVKQTRPQEQPERRFQMAHYIGSWVLFIVLGSVFGYLRYGGGAYTIDFTVYSGIYGLYVVLAFYILIFLKAMKDSIFQGISCLLVPFYSFYYMFMISDDFYMRAVFGGLLVGIGQDSVFNLQLELIKLHNIVTSWIASGGGG